jgi:hypothetical protein
MTRRALAILILERYASHSAAEYNGSYKCRRCCNVVGAADGSDDLVGLCNDCWCAVRPLVRVAGLDEDVPEQLLIVFPETKAA